MSVLRLNDTTIQVADNKIIIHDIFGDISDEEIKLFVDYLADEGFLAVDRNVHVTVRNKPFVKSKDDSNPKKRAKKG